MNIFRSIFCICLYLLSTGLLAQETMPDCHCAETGPGAPAGIYIDHVHPKKEWMLSYRYMMMNMQGNRSSNAKISNDQIYNNYIMAPKRMSMQMHMLMLMYGLTNKITFMAMSSYNVNSMNMSMMENGMRMHSGSPAMNSSVMTSQTSGIADTKIYILYELASGRNHQLVLSGGLNIPTGKTSLSGPSVSGTDNKYSYLMQPGTGSFAMLPGITHTWQTQSMAVGTQLSAAVRAGTTKNHYRWGNEANLSTWISRSWTSWVSSSIRGDISMNGRIRGYDPLIASQRSIDPTADSNNYGGIRSSLYGGLAFMIPQGALQGMKISAEYGLPVYQNLNGIQMSLSSTLYTSIQYGF